MKMTIPMFDLEKCMNEDGGWCLAGDRPARVVCTDTKGGFPLLVLVDDGLGGETADTYPKSGQHSSRANENKDLRNLQEYKEVEVTLWESTDGAGFTVSCNGQADLAATGCWRRYGKPAKARFERDG